MLYDAGQTSKLVAYLLWFLLACGHRFYLGRVWTGLAQLVLWVVADSLVIFVHLGLSRAAGGPTKVDLADILGSPYYLIGLALMSAAFVWWIMDAFLIPGWVRAHNEALRSALARR